MANRIEFMALYQGLLAGLNLVQQKSWDPRELEKYFPDLKDHWAPLLAARHVSDGVSSEKKRALEQLMKMLEIWDDPIEASILKRRLQKISGYFREVEKKYCDAESLQFFLQNLSLIEIESKPLAKALASSAPRLSALEASALMDLELKKLFPTHEVRTQLSSSTLARASTTKAGIRLREDATFSHEELVMLTVHEAWVHLGTNLAGSTQKELPWLSSWHPGVTGFQEGLALIAEIISGHWDERRESQVLLRHEAASQALKGENARQVWSRLCDQGMDRIGSLEMVLRVFRGCHLEGGMAFGKEFQYLLGLHQWLGRQNQLTVPDMRLALAGKMDFLEWEILRGTHLKEKVLLAEPPRPLLEWPRSHEIMSLRARLTFKKAA